MYSPTKQNRQIAVLDLGSVSYEEAWQRQRRVTDAIVARKAANRTLPPEEQQPTANVLFFCEHCPPVYTLGKSGLPEHLLRSEEELRAEGVEFVRTDRGGDITFHGPGQLVIYPVLDLENFFTDIGRYLRALEEAIIRVCFRYGVHASRIPGGGFTGVWVGADTPFPRKIAALGVKCTRWVTLHGAAFNLTTDLSYFRGIVPCGINPEEKGITSLLNETGIRIAPREAVQPIKEALLEVLEATEVPPTSLPKWVPVQ